MRRTLDGSEPHPKMSEEGRTGGNVMFQRTENVGHLASSGSEETFFRSLCPWYFFFRGDSQGAVARGPQALKITDLSRKHHFGGEDVPNGT